MRSPISRRTIQPKFSTMPRQKNQATAYLEIYQLAVEKNRLLAELAAIEKRKVTISQRLEAIAEQIDFLEDFLEKSAPKVKGNFPASESTPAETTQDLVQSPAEKKSEPKAPQPDYHLETMTLDY